MTYRPADVPIALVGALATMNADDAAHVLTAFQFAAAAHARQHRDEGAPYIDHPVAVASILWSELGCRDVDALVAALNHDVLEDCPSIDRALLAGVIGERATRMVEDVSKPSAPCGRKAERDLAYLDSLPGLPVESRLLKLADRIHNLRCVHLANDRAKARRYLDASRDFFVPLALATDPAAVRLVTEACDQVEAYLSECRDV